jgi:hypothetical protein
MEDPYRSWVERTAKRRARKDRRAAGTVSRQGRAHKQDDARPSHGSKVLQEGA